MVYRVIILPKQHTVHCLGLFPVFLPIQSDRALDLTDPNVSFLSAPSSCLDWSLYPQSICHPQRKQYRKYIEILKDTQKGRKTEGKTYIQFISAPLLLSCSIILPYLPSCPSYCVSGFVFSKHKTTLATMKYVSYHHDIKSLVVFTDHFPSV